jgi:DNA-binding transcriptional MerR regulator
MQGGLRDLRKSCAEVSISTMSAIRTNAAAAMLGVSANTLRSWEQRFGYPSPRRSEGGHRQFELTEIEALRQAFEETHNISSAISIARERGAGLASPSGLRGALAELDQERADRLLEESLAVRSVERTVSGLLLPAIQALREETSTIEDTVSPEYGFAWRYATGWLAAALRVAPPAPAADTGASVLIVDATRAPELDVLHVQALELFLRRGGARVHALRALCPRAMVLSGGRGASLEAFGRLVYAARQSCGGLAVLDYRGAVPDTGASTVAQLDDEPQAAAAALRALLSSWGSTQTGGASTVARPRPALGAAGASQA